jgi:hypothetical protein
MAIAWHKGAVGALAVVAAAALLVVATGDPPPDPAGPRPPVPLPGDSPLTSVYRMSW